MEKCPDGTAELLTVADGKVDHAEASFLGSVQRDDDVLVLVDFWAPWCGPCVRMNPEIEAVKKKWGDKLVVVKVDVNEDVNVPLATFFQIEGIPHMKVFRTGKPIHEMTGLHSAGAIESKLNSLL